MAEELSKEKIEEMKLLDLLQVIRTFLSNVNLDVSSFAELIQAITPLLDNEPRLDSVEHTSQRLDEVLVALRVLTRVSKSDADDRIVEFLDAIMANPNIKTVLSTVIYHFLKENREGVEKLTAEDWSKIMRILELLWQIFQVWSGKSNSIGG